MNAPRPLAQDIGLFLVLALFANLLAVAAVNGVSARELAWSFYLIAMVHVGATLHGGAFDRARTISWVMLILGWFVAECASFMNYVMPMGQFFFWVATHAPWAQPLLERLMASPSILPVVLLAILAVDTVLAHRSHWRGRPWSWLAALVAVAVVAGLVLGIAAPSLLPRPQPVPEIGFDIVPSWHVLPFYAMLRAVPDKASAVAIVLIAIALPVFWPWMRVDLLRRGALRLIWLLAWLGFVAAFVGLGYLGVQPPEGTALLTAQVLTGYYFAFLLILPPLIGRFGGMMRATP